jgi:transcriptional regulator with XRE-family HTH domain
MELADMQTEGIHGIMITAAQCRSARTLLSWSVGKLASAASVSESAVDNFELERQPPDALTADAIQRALEDVGVVFLPGEDVRLRADPSAVR